MVVKWFFKRFYGSIDKETAPARERFYLEMVPCTLNPPVVLVSILTTQGVVR